MTNGKHGGSFVLRKRNVLRFHLKESRDYMYIVCFVLFVCLFTWGIPVKDLFVFRKEITHYSEANY